MPNKTIPQLPEQTGKTDDDLLVIVDSGETTTSKIKVSTLLDGVGGSPYIPADGTNNVVSDYYATSDINSGATESVIIGGSGNTITSSAPYSSIFGGQDNNINNLNVSYPNTIIGSTSSEITNTNQYGSGVIIAGGYDNIINNSGYGSAVFGGWLNETKNLNAWGGITAGGTNNYSSGRDSGVFTGDNNDATGNNSAVIGGQNNLASGQRAVVVGGGNNTASGEYAVVVGGGANNRALQLRSVVVGGESNQVNGGQGGVVVGGVNNVVSHNYSVALGGAGLSTLQNNEAVAEKFRIASYASLDFPDDATAAANGVQLGELYHTSGAVKIRIV